MVRPHVYTMLSRVRLTLNARRHHHHHLGHHQHHHQHEQHNWRCLGVFTAFAPQSFTNILLHTPFHSPAALIPACQRGKLLIWLADISLPLSSFLSPCPVIVAPPTPNPTGGESYDGLSPAKGPATAGAGDFITISGTGFNASNQYVCTFTDMTNSSRTISFDGGVDEAAQGVRCSMGMWPYPEAIARFTLRSGAEEVPQSQGIQLFYNFKGECKMLAPNRESEPALLDRYCMINRHYNRLEALKSSCASSRSICVVGTPLLHELSWRRSHNPRRKRLHRREARLWLQVHMRGLLGLI